MDVCALQEQIIANPEHIYTIVSNLGHENIVDKGAYYQFRNIGGDNNSGCSIRKADLVWSNFSHGKSGNIWTMLQDELGCSFKEALYIVGKWLNIEDCGYIPREIPFKNFYTNVVIPSKNEYCGLATHQESELPNPTFLSKKFSDDGVSPVIQRMYGVRYDIETDGIVIPWRNTVGELVGAKWRNNDPNCSMSERWRMYIKFPMSKVVYGWSENYGNIVDKQSCIIFEAEKSVLQCRTFGVKNAVAIGGHNISDEQARLIRALMCNKIIVAFDEGISEDEIRFNVEKLKLGEHGVKLGYIYDGTGDYLQNKDSPSDHGILNMKDVFKHCIKWMG